MAEKATAAQSAATPQQNVPTAAERRRQSMADRQRNRLELVKRPGSTVIVPENPNVTYELLYNLRRIDQSMANLSRNVFQNGTDFSKIEKAGKLIEKLKTDMSEIAKTLSDMAGINYTEYQIRR